MPKDGSRCLAERRARLSGRRARRRAAGGAAALLLVVGGGASGQAPLSFREVRAFRAVGGVLAVATDGRGRVAAATDRAAWLSDAGASARRVLGAGGIHDLLFAADGALFVAADRGVFRVGRDGGVAQSAPGPGAARRVLRLFAYGGGLLAASEGGLFFSQDGRRWARVDGALPRGTVGALAASEGGRPGLLAAVDGDLYRIALREAAAGPVVDSAERVVLVQGETEVVDLAAAPEPGALYALGPRSLTLLELPGGGARGSRSLALPSGARAVRLAVADGRVWIATDRGLVSVPGMRGPVARAAGPTGTAPAADLAVAGEEILVAGSRGLWVGQPAGPPAAARPRGAGAGPPSEPGIVAVQRAVLRYLDLGPGRLRALQRGVDRRGWLPTLEIDGGWGGTRQWGAAQDDTFTYGSLHHLGGSDWDRKRSFDVGVALRWELGDIAFAPDAIDVSKEARAVIELRDEVLDQVEQLYFERRRVLLEISSLSDAEGAEARRLRIRAAELGSGLDAWTGGWWSDQLRTSRNASPRDPDPEMTP